MTKLAPIVISLYRYEYEAACRMAAKGDENARHALDSLWEPYFGTPLACFLCHRDAGYPPAGTQPLPDSSGFGIDTSKIILVPICAACWSLPLAVRANACITMLKSIYSGAEKRCHSHRNQPTPKKSSNILNLIHHS